MPVDRAHRQQGALAVPAPAFASNLSCAPVAESFCGCGSPHAKITACGCGGVMVHALANGLAEV